MRWDKLGYTPILTKMWDHGYADILTRAARGQTITPCEDVAASYDNGEYLHGDGLPPTSEKYIKRMKKFKKAYWTKIWLRNGWGTPPDHLFED